MSGENTFFDELLARYYNAWLRYHPEEAVDVGVYDHADKLTPCDDADIGALKSLNENLIDSIESLDFDALDADRQLDAQIAYGGAMLELEMLVEHDWRKKDPGHYLPVNAIHQLTLRNVDNLGKALAARLGSIPAALNCARLRLSNFAENVPALWINSALDEAQAGTHLFDALPQHPGVREADIDGLGALIADANTALLEYARFLDEDLRPQARGHVAAGERYFNEILHYRHGMDIDADAVEQLGERVFHDTLKELKSCVRDMGMGSVAEATAHIHAQHPTADMLLETYRQKMEAARQFVTNREWVNIPETQELNIVDTPEFLRHSIPFAAYVDPVPSDPHQRGWFYVTPVKDDSQLGEHNLFSIAHTAVHEAWPGHHLQFVTANTQPQSSTLPRLLNPSATLYEGWALYCEQMAWEQGFYQGSEHHFVLLKDQLWRALRIMIDVGIHCREAAPEKSAELLMKHLGFTEQQASAEINWYSHAPGVPMGYATGWQIILALRDIVMESEGTKFSLKEFNNKLLSAGSAGLGYVIRRVWGAEVWETVKKQVFQL